MLRHRVWPAPCPRLIWDLEHGQGMDKQFKSQVSWSRRVKEIVTDNGFGHLGRAIPETVTLALGQNAMPMEGELGEVTSRDGGPR
jgi:hypothetical protein